MKKGKNFWVVEVRKRCKNDLAKEIVGYAACKRGILAFEKFEDIEIFFSLKEKIDPENFEKIVSLFSEKNFVSLKKVVYSGRELNFILAALGERRFGIKSKFMTDDNFKKFLKNSLFWSWQLCQD